MILTILSIVITVLGIFLIYYPFKKSDVSWVMGPVITIVGAIMTVSCVTFAVCSHTVRNREYIRYQTMHESLEKRIELVKSGCADNVLWSDIMNFNIELKEAQHWKKSLWTNILNNDAPLYFDEIEIPANLEESYEQETVEKSVQE